MVVYNRNENEQGQMRTKERIGRETAIIKDVYGFATLKIYKEEKFLLTEDRTQVCFFFLEEVVNSQVMSGYVLSFVNESICFFHIRM